MADTATHGTELGTEHLPFFITAPGQPDILFNAMVVFLVLLLFLVGNFYMHLHSVPDRMAHKANNAQLQLIGILTLIALLTHSNIYWVAALVLAAINLPDFMTPLSSIARSLRKLAQEPEPQPEPTAEKTAHDV
ncbi:MAG: hypothetical protein NXH97_16525 [Rhodobacteraceae bacterium]|nr:hypothetical protein [Paracoccaceae bacterium]